MPQVITVDSKLIIPTNCSQGESCWFTFLSEDTSPLLQNISSAAMAAGTLTLTGQRFTVGASTKVSLTNKITGVVTVVTPTSFNETSAIITLPAIESGIYAVKARSDPIGESFFITLTINMNIAGVSASSLSINGGLVKITGTGFPSKWPNNYYNRMAFATGTRNLPINIASISTTEIVLKVPTGITGRSYTFSLTTPMGVIKSMSFSQSSTATPKVNLVSTAAILPNTPTTINLNRTVLPTIIPEILQLYSLTNSLFIYNVSTWVENSTQLSFNVTLNSGKYGFTLFDDLYGWYSVTSTTFLSVSKSPTAYTVTPISTSFNGGVVTVTGDNIGDGATITVNGYKGNVLSRTASSAVFNVPQLVTPSTQTLFKMAKNKTISLGDKTKWGDTAGWEAAFDSEHSTMYSSNKTSCNVGIDIGANLGVQLTRIRYFPNPSWNIAYQFIKGAQIQVSNDNTTWTTIATVDQTVHAGWNSFMITNTNIFRYIRFLHDSKSKCNIAEL